MQIRSASWSQRLGLMLAGIALATVSRAALAEQLLDEKPTEKSGVSIRLPRGWQVEERRAALLLARAEKRDKDNSGEFRTLLTLTSDAGTKVDGAAQQARAAREYNDYRAEEKPEEITINGLKGERFGGTMSVGSVKLRSRQYLLLHENRIYTLTFICLASQWNTYVGAIEASVATFQVSGK
jgi:hypothetical protein